MVCLEHVENVRNHSIQCAIISWINSFEIRASECRTNSYLKKKEYTGGQNRGRRIKVSEEKWDEAFLSFDVENRMDSRIIINIYR